MAVNGKVKVVPPKLSKFGKVLWTIDAIWGFASVIMFLVYTLNFYRNTGYVVPSTIGFVACGVYAVLLTALLIARAHDAKDKTVKRGKKTAARTFKYITSALKIVMILLTMISLLAAADDFSDVAQAVWQSVSIVWIVLSVALDLLLLAISRRIAAIKERAAERVERGKAALSAGKDALLTPVRAARRIFGRDRAKNAGSEAEAAAADDAEEAAADTTDPADGRVDIADEDVTPDLPRSVKRDKRR